MKEITHSFHNSGAYHSEFENDTHLKLHIQPHSYSTSNEGETLQKSSLDEYVIVVSNDGQVLFYDGKENLLGQCDKSDCTYCEVRFLFENEQFFVVFGYTDIIDYYPHCDGEYDRWGTRWINKRKVCIDIKSKKVSIEE